MHKISNRVIAFVLSFILIINSFYALNVVAVADESTPVMQTSTQKIERFKASLVSGAVNEGTEENPNYVWTPSVSDKGHSVKYQMNYDLSGEGTLPVNSVQITIPRHIFKDRNNRYADKFDIAVPLYTENITNNDVEFVYKPLNDTELLIYNRVELSAAQLGSIQISYITTKSTYEYVDGTVFDEFYANLNITKNANENLNTCAKAPRVKINTSADFKALSHYAINQIEMSWKNDWGSYANLGVDVADYYYYYVWDCDIYFNKNVTQYFDLTFNDVTSGEFGDARVLGYKVEGQRYFKTGNSITKYKADDDSVHVYVLTSIKRLTYKDKTSYKLNNKLSVTLHPYDGIDSDSVKLGSAEYTYVKSTAVRPGGSFDYRLNDGYNTSSSTVNFQLDEFKNGILNSLDEGLTFNSKLIGYPFPWTVDPNYTLDDFEAYGKVPVTYVSQNENFYFNTNITEQDIKSGVADSYRKLTADDFKIKSINFDLLCKDKRFDDNVGLFVDKSVNFNDSNTVKVYAKFEDSNNDFVLVGTYNPRNNTYSIKKYNYVSSFYNNNIVFNENVNCIGYKFVTSNAFFNTELYVNPSIELKNSDYILNSVKAKYNAGERRSYITSYGNGLVYAGSEGQNLLVTVFDYDTNFLTGYVKEHSLSKTVKTVSNKKIDKYVSVGWKVDFSEYYKGQSGNVYINQHGGEFYDIFPEGATLDISSLKVYVDNEMVTEADYTYSIDENFNNSNKIMLAIKINKEAKNGYTVYYNTIHSWESINDFGSKVLNSVMYKSCNETFSTGTKLNQGGIYYADLFENLSYDDISIEDRDKRLFAFSEHSYIIDVPIAVSAGLKKSVKAGDSLIYDSSQTVRGEIPYTYNIRYATDSETRAKNIVIFDNLENYIANHKRGVLCSIDVSELKNLGANPKIYCSEQDIDFSVEANRNLNINNWRSYERSNLSRVKSIAIDVSKDSKGNDFVLDYNKAIHIYVKMCVNELSNNVEDNKIYNGVHAVSDFLIENNISNRYVQWGYTVLDYRSAAQFSIKKVDETDSSKVLSNVRFILTGVSDYSGDVYKLKTTNNNGIIDFGMLEKGNYSLYEYDYANTDYFVNSLVFDIVVDANNNIKVNGSSINLPYVVSDTKRIHNDIVFNKRDLVNKGIALENVKFVLTGTSDYSTKVFEYSSSNSNGIVKFENIEKGTYIIKEVKTKTGYALNTTEYKVTIDDNAQVNIMKDGNNLNIDNNGFLTIYNEPQHRLVIHKVGTVQNAGGDVDNVAGAKLNLLGGTIDGDSVDMTVTTDSNGLAIFNGLRSGTYNLAEVEAPEGYTVNSNIYTVNIEPEGITIDGLEQDAQGNYLLVDKEAGTLEIHKKWVDISTDNREEPVIHVATSMPSWSVQFDKSKLKREIYASSSGDVAWTGITGFEYTSLSDRDNQILADLRMLVRTSPPNVYTVDGYTLYRVDDGATQYVLYAYVDSDRKLYWWTNARDVYMCSDCSHLFDGTGIESFDIKYKNINNKSGACIKFSRTLDLSYMFANSKLKTMCSYLDADNVITAKGMFAGCKDLTFTGTTAIECQRWIKEDNNYWRRGTTTLYCYKFSLGHSNNLEDISSMFEGTELEDGSESLDLNELNVSAVQNMSRMFKNSNVRPAFKSWENTVVNDMTEMFYNNIYIKAVELPHVISSVDYITKMFYGCQNLEFVDISGLETSNVQDMSYLFYRCHHLTSLNLSTLSTDSATTMKSMFQDCWRMGTLNLSGFTNTSNVTDMSYMFDHCGYTPRLSENYSDSPADKGYGLIEGRPQDMYFKGSFNIIGINNFDTSSVTTMKSMFASAGPVLATNIYNEKTGDIDYEFDSNYASDKSELVVLYAPYYIKYYNKIMDTRQMSVVDTGLDEETYTRGTGPNSWTIENGIGVDAYMELIPIEECTKNFYWSMDLSGWNTSNVTDMEMMFYRAQFLRDLNISNFDTTRVTKMCFVPEPDGGSIDRSLYTKGMFEDCFSLRSLDLSGFNTLSITNASLSRMFKDCMALTSISFGSNFFTSNITYAGDMFINCKNLLSIDASHFDFSNIFNMNGLCAYCFKLQNFDLGTGYSIENCSYARCLFLNCYDLVTLDLMGDFDTSANAGDYATPKMDYAFYNCESIVSLDFGDNFYYNGNGYKMFYNCKDLIYLYLGDCYTPNSIKEMFSGCESLRELTWYTSFTGTYYNNSSAVFRGYSDVTGLFKNCKSLYYLDISELPLNEPTSTKEMFYNCSSLDTLIWNEPDTSSVEDMSYMFYNCSAEITFDLNTSNVTDMTSMFDKYGYTGELYVDNFDTSSVKNMSYMFRGCKAEVKGLDNFDTSAVTDFSFMFSEFENDLQLALNTSSGNIKRMFYKFKGENLEVDNLSAAYVTDISYLFAESSVKNLTVGIIGSNNVRNMSYLFSNCKHMESLTITSIDTTKVTNMTAMFSSCKKITELDLTKFNTARVTNLTNMFVNSNLLETIKISSLWDVTRATRSASMFDNCTSIRGSNGTTYNSSYTDKTYARADTAGNPGYMTLIVSTGSGASAVTIKTTSSSANGESYCTATDEHEFRVDGPDDQTYIFNGLKQNQVYYVWEEPMEHYNTDHDYDNPLILYNESGTITNTEDIKTYNIILQKELYNREGDYSGLIEEDYRKTFKIKVNIGKGVRKSTSMDGPAGELLNIESGTYYVDHILRDNTVITQKINFENGEYTFPFKIGEKYIIKNVPESRYFSVQELLSDKDEDRYSVSYKNGTENINTVIPTSTYKERNVAYAQTSNNGSDVDITIINTKKYAYAYNSSVDVKIKKEVIGNVIDASEEFKFGMYLTDLIPYKEYRLISDIVGKEDKVITADEKGVAFVDFSMVKDETVSINLLVGSKYRIVEEGGNYRAYYNIVDANNGNNIKSTSGAVWVNNKSLVTDEEIVDNNEEVTVTYTNYKYVTQNIHIKKETTSSSENNQDKFSFNINLYGLDIDSSIDSNVGSFRADGDGNLDIDIIMNSKDEIILYNIPVGVQYKIKERESAYKASYTVMHGENVVESNSNNTVYTPLETTLRTVEAYKDVIVNFVNSREGCDVTITKNVDMTYGLLTKPEYYEKEFSYHIILSNLTGTLHDLETEFTYLDTTGGEDIKPLNELIGEPEDSVMSEVEFDITLKNKGVFKIRYLPVGANISITEQADNFYVISCSVSANDGAILQASDVQNIDYEMPLTVSETIDSTDSDIYFDFLNTYKFNPYILPAAGMNNYWYVLYGVAFVMLITSLAYSYTSYKRRKDNI